MRLSRICPELDDALISTILGVRIEYVDSWYFANCQADIAALLWTYSLSLDLHTQLTCRDICKSSRQCMVELPRNCYQLPLIYQDKSRSRTRCKR